jgi:hypothetical protein
MSWKRVYYYTCDGCSATRSGDRLPEGWSQFSMQVFEQEYLELQHCVTCSPKLQGVSDKVKALIAGLLEDK